MRSKNEKHSVLLQQVRIAPNWMSNANQQVRLRHLWGSDVYTGDSDIVAAIMHSGFYTISLPACPPAVSPVHLCEQPQHLLEAAIQPSSPPRSSSGSESDAHRACRSANMLIS